MAWNIRAEHLCKFYGYGAGDFVVKALNDVSITVNEGEMVAVCGKSGCGKSTLLSILGGLNQPNQGKVWLNDMCIGEMREAELAAFRGKHIGFVFQNFQLLPELTAFQNIAMGTLINHEPVNQERIHELADELELSGHLFKYPSEMSGGQQQRVAVLRAFVKNPEIILCDEPTGNLDQENSIQVVELMTRLARKQKKTIVMVTHDQEMAGRCDRLIYMRDGQIIDNL